MVEMHEDLLPELAWVEGDTYFNTRFSFRQEFYCDLPPQHGWFFPTMPPRFTELSIEQMIVQDELVIFSNYSGPPNIMELVSHLPEDATTPDYIECFMPHCDTIVCVNDDGLGVDVYYDPDRRWIKGVFNPDLTDLTDREPGNWV